MSDKYEIDSLDRKIIEHLQQNARLAYTELAKVLLVSPGTIHQRVERMKKAGIIEGSTLVINNKKLGLDVTAFLGIHLNSSKDLSKVLKRLSEMNEVVEVHYTTGNYALLIKVKSQTITSFHNFLANKLQAIESIRSTESFISLHEPISRAAKL